MDALSLAACVIQFLDFTCGLVAKGVAIHESSAGRTVDQDELEHITAALSKNSKDIAGSLDKAEHQRQLTSNEDALKAMATECQNITEELLSTLDHLRCKGARTAWKSFRHAIRSVWKEKEVQSLEKRLDRFRQQMLINLLDSLRQKSDLAIQEQSLTQNSMKRIEDILHRRLPVGDEFVQFHTENKSRWRNDLLRIIHEEGAGQIRLFRLNKRVDSNSPEVIREQEERIRGRVIHKLAFPDMTDRERRIPKAYQRTFEWIFREPDDACRPWSSFRSFLQDPSNKMYWITGKPGSGKSTLMKFIRHNPQTSSFIEAWGAGQDVVQVAFYFWNSGSHMQMSVDGLLQTLLHDCLRQLPRFVQQTLPERWEAATLFDEDDFPWCFEEAAHALRRLMSDICPDKKFFLIIDGLDECFGDHSRLIELLHELSDDIPNVKLCLASRPYNNFEDVFRGKPSLMLQHLTRADMELFVASKFQENEGFKELQIRDPDSVDELLRALLKKSEGVFLWVHLVVRSLLEGLTSGDGLRELHCRLAELPPDLEDLYQSILHRLDPRYLDHASRLFQIVRTYRECHDQYWNESPTLLRVALADLDDQLAFQTPVKPQIDGEILALCKNMRRKLVSRCHGLLEVSVLHDSGEMQDDLSTTSPGDGTDPADDGAKTMQTTGFVAHQEVQYLHRSVRDYIENPRVWNWLLSVTQRPFNPFLAFLRSSLLQLKHLPENLYPCSLCRSVAPSTTTLLLRSASISGSKMGRRIWVTIKFAKTALEVSREPQEEQEIVSLLAELDKTATLITDVSKSSMHIQTDQGTLGIDHWASFFLLGIPRVTFLHMMAVCGIDQYVARYYQKPGLCETENDAPFILTVLEGKADRTENKMYDAFEGPHMEVLRLVLQNGGNCHQEYEGRSAWSVAKERKQQKVLRLFQEFGPEPSGLSVGSGSPVASDTSDLATQTVDSDEAPSNAAHNYLDKDPRKSISKDCDIRRQKTRQRPRDSTTSVDFGLGSTEAGLEPVLPKPRPAGRSGESSRRAAFDSRNRHRPRNDRGLGHPGGPYEDGYFHEPPTHQTLPPLFPLSAPPPLPPLSRPRYYNYPHHQGPGPHDHYTDYRAYATDHRHYNAQYHSYYRPTMPPWPPVPRHYAPLPVSPFIMLPNPYYPAGQSISYRSGGQGEQSLTRSLMLPFSGAGFF